MPRDPFLGVIERRVARGGGYIALYAQGAGFIRAAAVLEMAPG